MYILLYKKVYRIYMISHKIASFQTLKTKGGLGEGTAEGVVVSQ